MEFKNSKIINCNGTEFEVGTDQYGWFSIVRVETWENPETGEQEVEDIDEIMRSFDPEGAEELKDQLEEYIQEVQ